MEREPIRRKSVANRRPRRHFKKISYNPHYHRLPHLHALILASTCAFKAHVEGGAGKGSTCAFKKRMQRGALHALYMRFKRMYIYMRLKRMQMCLYMRLKRMYRCPLYIRFKRMYRMLFLKKNYYKFTLFPNITTNTRCSS